jgi:hypothetical protein
MKLTQTLQTVSAIALISSVSGFVNSANAISIISQVDQKIQKIAAQPANQSATVGKILLGLPRPAGSPTKLGTMSTPNAYQQKALNFQTASMPQPAVDFYRKELTKLGYTERTINATMGDWGFSIVFDSPQTQILPTQDPAKKAVLIIQGTKLAPNKINLNIRFEEI